MQKHRATRLHYDFRLEMDGVLKSWAVPKGPSLDPADKRLAMQVEDHPVSYFDFEGIIPAGNYGAGTVMVWDVGTWEPEGDAHAMLSKGDFKFRLDGEKLKGSFALIHIRSRKPGNKGTEWLLIKHRDAYVQRTVRHRRVRLLGADQAYARSDCRRCRLGASGRAAVRQRQAGDLRKNDWLADSIAKADAKKGESAATARNRRRKAAAAKAKSASRRKLLSRNDRPPAPAAKKAVSKGAPSQRPAHKKKVDAREERLSR